MNILRSGLQGVEHAQAQFTNSAARITRVGAAPAAQDNVDLSQEAVSLLSAKNQFGASLDLIKVADEMLKSTLDLVA